MNGKSPSSKTGPGGLGFKGALILLIIAASIGFCKGYLPDQTVFSNDGPLGRLMAQSHRLPERFSGCWQDLNTFGFREGTAVPGISTILLMILRPLLFSKFYAPIGLTILGLGAWCFFRSLRLAPAACILGALAVVWNMDFFSTACWGVVAHPITVGMCFFALAALSDASSGLRWLRVVLAGFAVGMGVIEGADVGAIFSLFVAGYAIYQAFTTEGSRVKNLATGVGRVGLVAVVAAVVAAQSVGDLVATNINNVSGLEPGHVEKQEHWDWATQWSLPKAETLGLFVPGLFGYRPDTADGGEYWGRIGRAPEWDRYVENGRQGKTPNGFQRYTGGGYYLGLPVVILALWVLFQTLRGQASVFSLSQRKYLWFWAVVGVVALLLAWGRFAPFYRVLYSLPYFSSIRNPIKFLDLFSIAATVFFAYGVDALCRKYMAPAGTPGMTKWSGLFGWWSRSGKFEKGWLFGAAGVLGLAAVGWVIYTASAGKLIQYMIDVGIPDSLAPSMASFSADQLRWFMLFFVWTILYLAYVFAGAFGGSRSTAGSILLGVLLFADLGHANYRWIATYDYSLHYASNSVLDHLRNEPWKQRVALFPFVVRSHPIIYNLYQYEWLQYEFPYYNIQAVESPQMSRIADDLAAYQAEFISGTGSNILRTLPRFWQLTNTRFLLGPANLAEALNMKNEPRAWLRMVERFSTVTKAPGLASNRPENVSAASDPAGAFGLFEFLPALPRAVMYSDWQISTNQPDELKTLVDPAFDPVRTVLVAGSIPAPGTNQVRGRVEITSYSPRDVVLHCESTAPSVLLLNDHYDPNWRVFVDGKPDTIYRANFYMRGVYVTPGPHTVEFRFRVRTWPLYVTASGIAMGLLVLGVVIGLERRGNPALRPAAASPKPEPKEKAEPPQPAPAAATVGARNGENIKKKNKSRKR